MSFDAPPPPPGFSAQPPQGSPSNDKTFALLAHGLGLLFGFLAPLVILLTAGNTSPYVRRNAVEALNFQITLAIGAIISVILMIVLIGFLTFAVLGLAAIALPIVALIKVNDGEDFRYPLTLRLIK